MKKYRVIIRLPGKDFIKEGNNKIIVLSNLQEKIFAWLDWRLGEKGNRDNYIKFINGLVEIKEIDINV